MKKTTFCSIVIFIFFTGLVVLDNQQAEAWTAAKRLTWMPGYSNEPAIVMAPDGVLHVIWEDDVNGNSEIYHKKSTNNGNSWTGAKRLTWMPGDSQHPVIATDSTSSSFGFILSGMIQHPVHGRFIIRGAQTVVLHGQQQKD